MCNKFSWVQKHVDDTYIFFLYKKPFDMTYGEMQVKWLVETKINRT